MDATDARVERLKYLALELAAKLRALDDSLSREVLFGSEEAAELARARREYQATVQRIKNAAAEA